MVLVAAAICVTGAMGIVQTVGAESPAGPPAGTAADTSAVVGQLRAQLARERAEHRRELAILRGRLAARPDVRQAIALGAAAYGVRSDRLERVAKCESSLRPGAQNGAYLGLFQFGQGLWSRTPFRAFPRTDPYAAAFAASWAFSRGMAPQWPVCGRGFA